MQLDESQRLEYKETLVDGVKLVRSIASMVNADGGVIIIGVGTEGTKPVRFVGIPSTPNVEDTILNLVSAHLRPRPRVDVRQFAKTGSVGSSYVFVRVPWTENTPCEVIRWTDGEPLIPIRIGSDTRRASVSEITSLMRRRLSPKQEREIVEEVVRAFPLTDFAGPDSQIRFPIIHFTMVALTERFSMDMTSEADFEIAEAARFFGPFVSAADIRERLFGVRASPKLLGATYGQGSIEFRRDDSRGERTVATSLKITSSGGLYIAGLLGTDNVLLDRLLAYLLGSLRFTKWFLDRGFHHGKVFLRVYLANVGRRNLDMGFDRSFPIQLDKGCTIEKTMDYDELASPDLLTTDIARRSLREFQIAVPDERIKELVSSLENLKELT